MEPVLVSNPFSFILIFLIIEGKQGNVKTILVDLSQMPSIS